MAFHYIGIREELKEILNQLQVDQEHEKIQIIDLGGAINYNLTSFTSNVDANVETIILSSRRFDHQDELGFLEAELLNFFKHSILYRTSPLDFEIEIYRGWATVTGILLTAFSPAGVNWTNTKDVAEACAISKDDIRKRSGKAFELTGPRVVPMEELKSVFEQESGKRIDLHCKSKEAVIDLLLQNKMPLDAVEWLANFQSDSSDERLLPSVPTLEKIIGHPAREAQLYKSKKLV